MPFHININSAAKITDIYRIKQIFVIFIIKIANKMYYNMNKKLIRLTENNLHRIVKESVNRVINEINLGNGSIDFDDCHITSLKSNEDGYYEFEARCDNDWYTLRGSYYGNGEIELDFLLSGHSGYGRQIPINKKLQRWFDIYGRKELTDEIEYWIDNNMVEEPNYDEEY